MITSLSNARVKYVRRLQAERRFRQETRAFVVEGTRWLAELSRPEQLFYTPAWAARPEHQALLQPFLPLANLVSEEVMQAMSDTETPAGVLAILPFPDLPLPPHPHRLLILDQIRDPGNLGTIMRTAAAAGVSGVLLAPGCVDPFNPKVVRSGMGAHLRLPFRPESWEAIAQLTAGRPVWLADANGELPYTAVDWTRPVALIIGNEARGSGNQAEQIASGRVTIPMHAATESLNAAIATAIILFEALRQTTASSHQPILEADLPQN